MHRYTPSRERIRQEWMRSMRHRRTVPQTSPRIPDNSEPWQGDSPYTVGDLLRVSDAIAHLEPVWPPRLKHS